MSEDLKSYALPADEQIAIFKEIIAIYKEKNRRTGLCILLQIKLNELYCISKSPSELYLYFPLMVRDNSRKLNPQKTTSDEGAYWWDFIYFDYDSRIQFLEWMIQELEGTRATQECDPSKGNSMLSVEDNTAGGERPAGSAKCDDSPTVSVSLL